MTDGASQDRRGSIKSVSFKVEEGSPSTERDKSASSSQGYRSSKQSHPSRSEIHKYSKEIRLEILDLRLGNNLTLLMTYFVLMWNTFLLGTQSVPRECHSIEFRCKIDELEATNWTFYEMRSISSPTNEDTDEIGCSYYVFNYTYLSQLTYAAASLAAREMTYISEIKQCKEYVYKDETPPANSLTKSFDLICLRKILHSYNFFGQASYAVIGLPAGIAADVYGRRPTFIVGSVVGILGACLVPAATNLVAFVIGKIVLNFGLRMVMLSLFLIFAELCRPSVKSSLLELSCVAYHAGHIAAYAELLVIEDWRLMESITICALFVVLFGITFIPESPRWWLVKLQWQRSWQVLKEMGVADVPTFILNGPLVEETILEKLGVFLNPSFRNRICISIIISGIGSLTYFYAAIMKIQKLQISQLYVPVSFTQITGIIFMAFLALKISKKSLCCGLFLLLSVCFAASIFTDYHTMHQVTLWIIKVLATSTSVVIMVYVQEIFPTSNRGTMLGLNMSVTGMVTLAYLYYSQNILARISEHVLRGFFCSFCLMSAVITVLAPHPFHELPDTTDDFILGLTLAERISSSSLLARCNKSATLARGKPTDVLF